MTSSDIDRLFDDLAKVLEGVANTSVRIGRGEGGRFSAKMSLRIGTLDEILARTIPPGERAGPLIDVIEDADNYRVVVLLPGVRKEDITLSTPPGSIRVEVSKGDTVYAKEIPCRSAPDKIIVVSAKENNSVVEIVFSKKEKLAR